MAEIRTKRSSVQRREPESNEKWDCARLPEGHAFLKMLQTDKRALWLDWNKAKKGKGVERANTLRQLASSIGETLP